MFRTAYGDDFVGSYGGTLEPDAIVQVDLPSSAAAVGYDFSELPLGSISGYVYVDDNGDTVVPDFEAPDIRVICCPTTLSGGEFNTMGGVTDDKENKKQGYTHRMMAPVAIVLDPALTVHTPEWLWTSTGVRSVDHALEALGSLQSNYFCDGVA